MLNGIDVQLILLWILGLLTLISSVYVLYAKQTVHAAVALFFTTILVALIFLVLNAEYLFVIQLIIYTGGIVVLISFSVMFTGSHVLDQKQWLKENKYRIPLFVIFAAFPLLAFLFAIKTVLTQPFDPSVFTIPNFSKELFITFAYIVIFIGMMISVAMLGGIKIIKKEDVI